MKSEKLKKPKKVNKPIKPSPEGKVEYKSYNSYNDSMSLQSILKFVDENNINPDDVDISCDADFYDGTSFIEITYKVHISAAALEAKYEEDLKNYNEYKNQLNIYNAANEEIQKKKINQKLEKDKIALEKQLNEIYKKLHGVTNEEQTSN